MKFQLDCRYCFRIVWFFFRMGITLIVFVLFLTNSFGQEPYFEQITTEDGLPSMTVYEMAEGKDGHMYIGTDKGLFKYNGTTFKRISPENVNEEVYQLTPINDSTFVYINSSKEISIVTNDNVLSKKIDIDNYPSGIEKLNDSLIYITSSTKKGLEETIYNLKNLSIDKNVILDFRIQKSRGKFLDMNSKLLFANSDFENIHKIGYINGDSISINKPFLKGNIEKEKTRYWKTVSTPKKQFIDIEFKEGKERIVYLDRDFENEGIRCIYYSNDSTLLLGTNNGLRVYDPSGINFRNHYFKGVSINSTFKDSKGTMWLGTASEGIIQIPNLKLKKLTFEGNPILYKFLDDKSVRIISDNGMYYQLKNIAQYVDIKKNLFEEPRDFLTINGRSFVIMNDSIIEINLESPNQSFNTVLKEGDSYVPAYKNVQLLSNNKILIANSEGLYLSKLKQEGKRFIIYDEQEIFSSRSTHIYPVNDDYFVLTLSGLIKFDTRDESVKLIDDEITASATEKITFLDDNNYLYTTNSGKLILKTDLQRRVIEFDDYLPTLRGQFNHLVYKNTFLLFNKESAFKIDPKQLDKPIKVDINSYINLKLIKDIHYSNGEFSILYQNGLVRMNEDQFFENQFQKAIEITQISVNDETVSQNENLFKYNQNNINIELEAATLNTHNSTTFFYKIEGLNDRWESVNANEISLNLDNLKPGPYTIKAISSSQKVIDKASIPPVYSFRIKKPFWGTTLFFISAGILLVLTSAYITGSFIERRRKAYLLAVELDKHKNKAFKAQIKPHFIFNSLSSLLGLIATNQKEEALNHVGDLSSFLRSTLYSSETEWIQLEDEFNLLENYISLENVRFNDDIQLIINVDEDIDVSRLQIPPLLIQPIIENAVNHGLTPCSKKGRIEIAITSLSDNKLKIIIIDNGEGYYPKKKKAIESEGGGYGLKLTEQRLKTLNKKVDTPLKIGNHSQKNGTIVEMIVPFKNS